MAEATKKFNKPDKIDRSPMSPGQVETLISCVEGRKALWDPSHSEYKSSARIKRGWFEEIGRVVQFSGPKCFNKWKNLMREFKAEDRDQPKSKSGDAASTYEPKFKYYTRMRFLLTAQSPRDTTGNLDHLFPEQVEDKENIYDDDMESDAVMNTPNPPLSLLKDFDSATKVITPSSSKEITQMEATLDEIDEHEHYLRSIVPRINHLSEIENILFRDELMDLVIKYVYQK